MTQGEVLRQRRHGHALTQARLSELSGVSQSMISAVERGQRRLEAKIAKKLAVVLRDDWTIFFADELCHSKKSKLQRKRGWRLD